MSSQVANARFAAMRTLVATVDLGGFTAAARRVGLTPSAVSKQIARLEDDLGARLLERTTRRLRPTPAGLAAIDRLRPLFEAFDDAVAAVCDEQGAVRGRVRISASRAFGRARLLPLVAELAAAHPDLAIDVVLSAARLDFIEDEIDLAVREGSLADSSLTAVSLGATEIVLAAAPDYLARRGRPRRPDDLVAHDVLCVPPSGPASDISQLRGRNGRRLHLQPRLQVNDLFALRDLAERGAGIAVVPDYVAAPAFTAGVLVPLLPRLHLARVPLHVVYPSRRHLPMRVRVVIDALRARARTPEAQSA
jgi:DNA-binding transcriptional LysR family regulator